MDLTKVIVWQVGNKSLPQNIATSFNVVKTTTLEETLSCANEAIYKALIVDLNGQTPLNLDVCKQLTESGTEVAALPLVVLSPSLALNDKLRAFDVGCDDYIEPGICAEEITARINKAIFHRIASKQLKDRLELANATAYSVMSDNSDLGANIQFLLEINHCDNIDQLGQLFFRLMGRYGLSVSLQMRSLYGVKNMEANGMAKDLESQLLWQMKDSGRYVDFGRRTLMNYGRCSLLVRNMPVDDEVRYGAIKDNTFALIQGVDARIKSLDQYLKLQEEKMALHKLSHGVKSVMTQIDQSYQSVMREIVLTVEDMSDAIQRRIPVLALSEEQESFFESVVDACVLKTNCVFNDGLKVDESFYQLSLTMEKALKDVEFLEQENNLSETMGEADNGDDGVELF